ncbi:MAG: TetR/AcrR family transcriptional regulator [Thermonemataceae bacterium]
MRNQAKLSKGERTKQEIIVKAAKLINEKGIAGTSIADLTKATKLTSGALYGSFSSKEDIVREAFDYNAQRILEGYRSKIATQSNAYEKIVHLLDFASQELPLLFEGGCPILNTAIEVDDTLPWMKQKVHWVVKQWVNMVDGLLIEGIRQRTFETFDTQKFSLYILSALEGAIMLAKCTDDVSVIENATHYIKEDLKRRMKSV